MMRSWKQVSLAVLLAVTLSYAANNTIELLCCYECCYRALYTDKVIAFNNAECRDGCVGAVNGEDRESFDASGKAGYDFRMLTKNEYPVSAQYCLHLTCSRPDGWVWPPEENAGCTTNNQCGLCPQN